MRRQPKDRLIPILQAFAGLLFGVMVVTIVVAQPVPEPTPPPPATERAPAEPVPVEAPALAEEPAPAEEPVPPEEPFSLDLDHYYQALSPEPVHPKLAREVLFVLAKLHYSKPQYNPELSQRVLENYLDRLDPQRDLLLQSDVAEFRAWGKNFIIDFMAGRLGRAYDIYNRYHSSRLQRLIYQLELLQDSALDLTFPSDETLRVDRSEQPWPANAEARENLWRKRLYNSLIAGILNNTDPAATKKNLKNLTRRLRNQLKLSAKRRSEDVFSAVINAAITELDPHSQYLSPRASEDFEIGLSLSLEGIGAVLRWENDYTKVHEIVPAGPADKSGELKVGERIIAVAQGEDGEFVDVVGQRLDEVVGLIRGPKGSTVRLKVIGADDETDARVIRLVRNVIKLEEQAAKKKLLELDAEEEHFKFGIIRLPTFYLDFAGMQRGERDYKSSSRDVQNLLRELKGDNVDGLILDLRDNNGGSLDEANKLTSLFIHSGATVQVRNARGRLQWLGDRRSHQEYGGPLLVLINRLSASASEIFAGAIQDYERGLVVGVQSFGKGTVQRLQSISHGQLKLTESKFYRVSGDSTQHRGVIPDIKLPSLYSHEDVGESSYDTALPWDTIASLSYRTYPPNDPYLPSLKSNYLSRRRSDPGLLYLDQRAERLARDREQKVVSLNLEERRREHEQDKAWRLGIENDRRTARGEEPFDDYKAYTTWRDEGRADRAEDPTKDVRMMEAARILADYIKQDRDKLLSERTGPL